MSAESVLDYLRQMCADIDAGRPLSPYVKRAISTLAVPAALAVGVAGAAGCPSTSPDDPTTPGPAPAVETACDDAVDDDGDGAVDCADSDCAEFEACMAVPEYMAPMPPPDEPGPGPVAEYAAPYPGDDPVEDPGAGAVAEYAAPMPGDSSDEPVLRYAAPRPR